MFLLSANILLINLCGISVIINLYYNLLQQWCCFTFILNPFSTFYVKVCQWMCWLLSQPYIHSLSVASLRKILLYKRLSIVPSYTSITFFLIQFHWRQWRRSTNRKDIKYIFSTLKLIKVFFFNMYNFIIHDI